MPGPESLPARRARRGLSTLPALAVVAVVLLLLLALAVAFARRGGETSTRADSAGGTATLDPPRRGPTPAVPRVATAADLAALPKPAPRVAGFRECPADGDGGDRDMNRLKNRADSAAFVPVPLALLLSLPWPEDVERRDRENWRPADVAEIRRYEGAPVQVEGYVADARTSGPESVNCHGAANAYRDWHVWIVAESAGPGDRARSLVVEPTPQMRARHPGWTLAKLRAAGRAGHPVRTSGWLLLDPEHPDQVGRTRGTIWEIHPVVAFEVRDAAGRWVPLDAYTPPPAPRRTRTRAAR